MPHAVTYSKACVWLRKPWEISDSYSSRAKLWASALIYGQCWHFWILSVCRETPTAAGPNSFGKGRLGFCDRQKIIERELVKKTDSWSTWQKQKDGWWLMHCLLCLLGTAEHTLKTRMKMALVSSYSFCGRLFL